MSAKRICWHADESFYDPQDCLYVVAEITEDEAGYRVAARWADFPAAKLDAESRNVRAGLTDTDVLDIRASSMAASVRGRESGGSY